jgi:hypothetical protein
MIKRIKAVYSINGQKESSIKAAFLTLLSGG